jgi:hypothetical protein
VDGVGGAEGGDFFDPREDFGMIGHGWCSLGSIARLGRKLMQKARQRMK